MTFPESPTAISTWAKHIVMVSISTPPISVWCEQAVLIFGWPPASAWTSTPRRGHSLPRSDHAHTPTGRAVKLSNSRGLAFVNAGLNLSVLRLTVKLDIRRKDQNLSTNFQDFDTTKGKFFAGSACDGLLARG